jgi:hypothetical protein
MLSNFLMRSGVRAEVPSPWDATAVVEEQAHEKNPPQELPKSTKNRHEAFTDIVCTDGAVLTPKSQVVCLLYICWGQGNALLNKRM